ncbi:MAG: hypothetical protein E7374_03885 [Clostridiales bacterium]|nr:hypothetical protein [Clostridiales bacterium]
MKSIFKAVAIVTIFSVITRALGFLFRIFISRKLGAEGLGLFQIATSILGIFMTLVSSGLPLTTAKLVSKYEANNELKKRNQAVASALIIALALSVLSSFVIVLLKNVWKIVLADNRAVEILIILIPSIAFSAIYAVFRGALWGQNDYFNCGLTELLEQIFRFALTFFMLLNATDLFVATKNSAYAFNLTCLLSALMTIVIYFRKSKLSFRKGEYKNVLKSALPVTGVRLSNSLVQPLTSLIIPSMLILSGYTRAEAVASYGVVMGMTFPLLFVPMSVIGSISMVLIPSISSMMSKNDYSSIEENINKSINVSVFISAIFIPLYLSVGDLIGIVLFDNVMSGVLLQISAICVLPITLCNLTGSILNALSLEGKSFLNYILGSVVLIASIVIFTPIIGINSIIVSFFLSMTLISLLNLSKIKKKIPNFNLNIINLTMKYSLIITPSSLIGHFISNIMLNFFPVLISGVIGGSIAIILVLSLIKTFNLYDVSAFLDMIKRKRKSKQI